MKEPFNSEQREHLMAVLDRYIGDVTAALHELTRDRDHMRMALRRIRTGEEPWTVLAWLEQAGVCQIREYEEQES